MYSWNRRTGLLDRLAANVGLEMSYAVLEPLSSLRNTAAGFWTRYFELVGVREENLRLKAQVENLRAEILSHGEDLAELARLRALVELPVDVSWRPLACRVLAGRLGPNAVLDSITINRGYAGGARPGLPLVTNLGLVGRVLRASPHAATALLITDPKSRVSVFGQETRASGILKGRGMDQKLEVDFVRREAPLKNGEVLVTSGLDGKYPKGLPVGRVASVAPSDYTEFMAVEAAPLVDLEHLEEVLLLEKTGLQPPPEEPEGPPPVFIGPPLPPALEKSRAAQARQAGAEIRPAPAAAAGAQGATNLPAAATPPAPGPMPANQANQPNQADSGAQAVSGPTSGPTSGPAPGPAPVQARTATRPGQPEGGGQRRGISPAGQRAPLAPIGGGEAPMNSEGSPRWRVIQP